MHSPGGVADSMESEDRLGLVVLSAHALMSRADPGFL